MKAMKNLHFRDIAYGILNIPSIRGQSFGDPGKILCEDEFELESIMSDPP